MYLNCHSKKQRVIHGKQQVYKNPGFIGYYIHCFRTQPYQPTSKLFSTFSQFFMQGVCKPSRISKGCFGPSLKKKSCILQHFKYQHSSVLTPDINLFRLLHYWIYCYRTITNCVKYTLVQNTESRDCSFHKKHSHIMNRFSY